MAYQILDTRLADKLPKAVTLDFSFVFSSIQKEAAHCSEATRRKDQSFQGSKC
jgi:hypothetical protein